MGEGQGVNIFKQNDRHHVVSSRELNALQKDLEHLF